MGVFKCIKEERVLCGNVGQLIKEDKLEINDDSKMPELPSFFFFLRFNEKDKMEKLEHLPDMKKLLE